MIAFIDDYRQAYGVEPICKVLPIAPSSYHAHVAQRIDAGKRSARARRDAELKIEVQRVFAENFGVYGARKVWRQLQREGVDVARCTIERLMASLGLQGVIRGKPVRTTISDKTAPCPLDHVNRQFHAPRPNALWVSDFTYVATWSGFVYVAFVIDAYARRIVGWRASRTAHASFVLDALDQALHDRRPVHRGGLVHHSDRGSQSDQRRPATIGIKNGPGWGTLLGYFGLLPTLICIAVGSVSISTTFAASAAIPSSFNASATSRALVTNPSSAARLDAIWTRTPGSTAVLTAMPSAVRTTAGPGMFFQPASVRIVSNSLINRIGSCSGTTDRIYNWPANFLSFPINCVC